MDKENLLEGIKLYKKYIKLLSKEIDSHVVYLHIHGITTPEKLVKKGVELRNKIKQFEKENNIR